jgi:hypothetical protein
VVVNIQRRLSDPSPRNGIADEVHGIVPVDDLIDGDQGAVVSTESLPPLIPWRPSGQGREVEKRRGSGSAIGSAWTPAIWAYRSGRDTIGGTRRVWVMKRDESG